MTTTPTIDRVAVVKGDKFSVLAKAWMGKEKEKMRLEPMTDEKQLFIDPFTLGTKKKKKKAKKKGSKWKNQIADPELRDLLFDD